MAVSSEDDLIARYFRPLAQHPAARGLLDDAAVLSSSPDDLVITTDAIVEGVHFLPDDPPDTIARKALRVNLSDLAAKGAIPAGFVLTLALATVSEAFLAPFAGALGDDANLFACPLLGGDTVATPGPLTVSITAFGRVPTGKAVHRQGARPGDHIFVSGTIGDATLGLDVLQQRLDVIDDVHRRHLVDRYRVPRPRLPLADALSAYATAAMDVSDGLAGDLAKLCAASRVSARIDASRVPLSDAGRAAVDSDAAPLSRLLSGGDDYEVLCTVPAADAGIFARTAAQAGQAVVDIGIVTVGSEAPVFIGIDGRAIAFATRSFSHFSSRHVPL